MTAGPPSTIGRYEIRGELGRGMMGVVYRASDPVLGRDVALKVIQLAFSPSEQDRQTFEQRFFAEARTAARLSHPGILVVHDVGRDESGALFMALELLRGQTLDRVLAERGAIEWRQALRIAQRVADALHHAHAAGVVHRDVKPANIMLLESGEPKIMDFGIAKIEASHLTATGQFLGTPLYMSPEQALAHAVDGRSDLFSLGSVLYEMLTGRQAFAGETVTKIIFQVVSREPEPATLTAPELPEPLDYVLARCLAKDVNRRYPDGRTLADDLEDILAERPPRGRASWQPAVPSQGTLIAPAAAFQSDVQSGVAAPPAPPRASQFATPMPVKAAHTSAVAGAGASARAPARREPARRLPATAARGPAGASSAAGPAPPNVRRWVLVGIAAGVVLAGVAIGAYELWRAAGQAQAPVARRVSPPPSTTAAPSSTRAENPLTVAASDPSPDATHRADEPPRQEASRGRQEAEASDEAEPRESARSTGKAKAAATEPALLLIDFEHSLKSGLLRVWVDEDLVVEESIGGRVTRDIVGIKFRKGRLSDSLEVTPGRREVRMQVAWDDNVKTKSAYANFKSHGTFRLKAKLGGLGGLKKDLSLEWQ